MTACALCQKGLLRPGTLAVPPRTEASLSWVNSTGRDLYSEGRGGTMFVGFVGLGEAFRGIFLTKNANETPVNPDANPIFKVYGPGGLMSNGTLIASKLDSDDGLYQYAIKADPSNGCELGTCYRVFIIATVQGTTVAYEQSFIFA